MRKPRPVRHAGPAASSKAGHEADRRRTTHERRGRGQQEPANDKGLIYGIGPVLEALRSKARRIEKIIIAEGTRERRLDEIFDLARDAGVRVDKSSREDLTRMTGPDATHQGIAAVASAAEYSSVDEILREAAIPLLVILDGVEDPRNLGAVIRTAECAGADGVIIPDRRAVGLTETAAKSSAGATEYLKVAKTTNINRLIDDLKKQNIWVVGTSGDASMDYTKWDWAQPSALVLGAEGSGLHRLVKENCDVLVKIPMYGKIESLNVSVAAGVVLFEARRQRLEKGG
ncbi:MAG TPA: 23S rRNA (guanosine(2251)-2'-O)-methyltransferase RlmB [Pyrinomonadaceae bacterium]|nr:23S rRNA (guanosine(2251)-2'-O)-methyltransferase RlmB [Pyrinomonadaceae bacterium]